MDTMKLYVYGLYDISDPKETIAYVGLTRNLRQRKLNHSGHARRAVGKWVRDIRSAESDFGMRVLEITDSNAGMGREIYWIERLKPILNAVISERDTPKSKRDLRHVAPHAFNGFIGTLAELEAAYIRHTIADCAGNKFLAATRLGIGRQTLYNKLAIM